LTRAAIGIGLYDDQMLINVRCDPQHFSRDDTRAFADLYRQRLARTTTMSPLPPGEG
jgi:hypothetical protein